VLMAADSPIAFFDLSWLAIRAAPPERIIAALDLSSPTPTSWRQGINAAVGDFWDFDAPPAAFLSRVFVTPEVAGWRLAVGGWFGGTDRERPGRDVSDSCRQLSGLFGEAHAFTSQGRMDWYSWCLARAGTIDRHFLWAESLLMDDGCPTPAELQVRHEDSRRPIRWRPDEGVVMAVARESSICPLELESMQTSGSGYIAVTAWGRQRGVPSRSLDE
jgi:hypothetical protein